MDRNYDEKKYWNNRYAAKLRSKESKCKKPQAENESETDEWYFSYSDIADVLHLHFRQLHRRSAVLDIGCGLSKIFDDLSQDNFIGPFLGVDYSPIVIAECRKNARKKNYHYSILDMMQTSLPVLPINQFGLIVDKATTDGILCSEKHLKTISIMYENAVRLLLPDGILMIITIKTVDDHLWFEKCLVSALLRSTDDSTTTKFTIHFHRCMSYIDGTDYGPNIFVIVKHVCKTYMLRSTKNRSEQDQSRLVTLKCY